MEPPADKEKEPDLRFPWQGLLSDVVSLKATGILVRPGLSARGRLKW